MKKILLILILSLVVSVSCWAQEGQDYDEKAQEYHNKTSADTLYPILELKALYYQNKQIIAELKNLNKKIAELSTTQENNKEQIKLLNLMLQRLESLNPPSEYQP
ncbi:MAG: hypothetical protein ABH954_03450 [Candidatus Omnitrophota bacterium]